MSTQTTKVLHTNSGAFYAKVNPYILNAIDGEGYDKTLTSDEEKLQFLHDCFTSEYVYPENVRRYPNRQVLFAQCLMGLPSCFHIDFENYKILELAKEWGSLAEDATEKQEDTVIENWFTLIALKTFKLFSQHNIK